MVQVASSYRQVLASKTEFRGQDLFLVVLVHSHGKTVKTASGKGCVSEPFQLLCTDLVSKQVSDLSCIGFIFGKGWLLFSMCLLVIFHTGAERGTDFSSQKLFHISFRISQFSQPNSTFGMIDL